MLWSSWRRTGSHWSRYGPSYCVLIALPLVMADLLRHVLNDAGLIDVPEDYAGTNTLNAVGWLFTVIFTWTGFIFMIIGTIWGANIVPKFVSLWRQYRSGSTKKKPAAPKQEGALTPLVSSV
eukprot:gnl/Spiro4/9889_TR5245_c0_g1_i1.p1 gnl/Spiro4/9889_TR5245_c0_g1~~gnl/Spiro4/9889_TR5245_c0_g1_i1.p1  ORF type:complete len:122 (-),score=28.48 gnl/Spiro4/9889_TR5245_c0_g1_i1:313-678(-)